jgi:hypothetical protein
MSRVEASTLHGSLLLIKKKAFMVKVGSKIWGGVRTRTYRAKFKYNGADYNFSLTDPTVRDAFVGKEEGDYPLTDVYA